MRKNAEASFAGLAIFNAKCSVVVCGLLAAGAVTCANAQSTAPKPVPVPRVTTTVVVNDKLHEGYLPETVSVGTLDGATLLETPTSVLSLTMDELQDQGARVLADVVKNDASIGEDYAPVGYYGDFTIRGYAIDLATGLQINNLTIAGEQDVPLENKERVEVLKGIAGIESGVTTAGGLFNYVTKRPQTLEAIDTGTDHRGTAYGAVDLGHLFGMHKSVGVRVNAAGEHVMSYVNHADGARAMGAASADWRITPKLIFKGDFEYQHKVQDSVCGYQLLGGTEIPDIQRLSPSTMLGWQEWQKPNTFDTHNSNARFDYDLPRAWRVYAAASYSHSLIDDNVVYAYGNSVAAPGYFFAPDGTFDIYDYRNPGELRINAQAESMVLGSLKTGKITEDLVAGVVAFRRSVQMPKHSVYDWVGEENIYAPNVAVPIEDVNGKPDVAAPRVLDEDNHQTAFVVQDRMHLPLHVQLIAGGRADHERDHNPSGGKVTDKWVWLPQYAATFNPRQNVTIYGNYSVMLSLGQQAPWWTDNGSAFLNPYYTRQMEVGAKYQPGHNLLLSAALFRMHTPYYYPRVIDGPDSFCSGNVAPGDLCFEQQGREIHKGVEFNAEGHVSKAIRLTASAAAMQVEGSNTGTAAYDDKQVINVPHVRTSLFADVRVPYLAGLSILPGWSYTGRKAATRDDLVSVGGYNLFNLGARYTPHGEAGHVTFRLFADNILDKRYWKDTGASGGDTFIHLGAPTTVRLSAHYTF